MRLRAIIVAGVVVLYVGIEVVGGLGEGSGFDVNDNCLVVIVSAFNDAPVAGLGVRAV